MTIPPKYEDVAAQLDAALGREAALREEIDMAKQVQETTDAIVAMVDGQRDHWIEKCGLLKQRLTVAEQRIVVLTEALEGMIEYFPEGHSDGECFSVERANLSLGRSNDCIHDWFPDYCLKCGITKP